MKNFKDILTEASGTYLGVLIDMAPTSALHLGIEIGSKKIKIGTTPNGIFIKRDDVKKLNKYIIQHFSKKAGAFDFSTDEFIPNGIRGIVK